ncbi:hypothetical protein [Mucilaginibacter paludis]|uniref:Lipoprotein n=1 Tax=Mucilaginibacter paludis DSM 18603 TaxID=714943 RepID=H1YFY8_9SPHI|nr:hypothetical protein [Mucilaginibacter paludis]EHQ26276.1 hypothetical protein Mucpa_2137 [Mucilaginibacter paludis DSM 18603]
MKNHISLFLLCVTVTLFSCKKNDSLVVDPYTPDPFARYDNASSVLDNQIFKVYTSTGIPLLYTDTLTKSPLVKLNVGYHLTSIDSSITYRLSKNTSDRINAVALIRDQIIPALGPKLKPYSIFMVDSVFTYTISYPNIRTKVLLTTYLGLNTVVIGKIGLIKNMIPDSVKTYKRDIFKSILTASLASQTGMLSNFYAVSASFYNKYVYGTNVNGYLNYQAEEGYGFIAPNGITPAVYYPTPSQATDLTSYLNVMLVLSASDFSAKYGSYPLVMSKYALLKQALLSLGFTFPQ